MGLASRLKVIGDIKKKKEDKEKSVKKKVDTMLSAATSESGNEEYASEIANEMRLARLAEEKKEKEKEASNKRNAKNFVLFLFIGGALSFIIPFAWLMSSRP